MIEEDKVTLTRTRAELVESLAGQLPAAERVRIQGELSLVNAKIKALNTIQAAQLKAVADQRKIAGLAEAQANAARASARVRTWPSSAPGEPGFGDPINRRSIIDDAVMPGDDGDNDPGQTAAIDGWIDAILLRHDVSFTRSRAGKLTIVGSSESAVIEMLIAGIYAAASGQELPDLPSPPSPPSPPPKAPKKTKKR